MRAVIVTGPPGSGKTAVLTALTNLLADEGVRHAAVEVEALAWTHPWPDDEAAFAHLRMVCRSFRERGYPLLVVSATLDGQEYRRQVIEAIGAPQPLLVRLHAPVASLRERIARREPASWSGLPHLLNGCEDVAARIAALPDVDLELGTENTSPETVAAAIRDAMALA